MCVCTTRGRVSIVLSGCGSASDAMSPTPPETVLLLGVLSGKQDSHLTFSGSEAPIVNRVLHWWWCFFVTFTVFALSDQYEAVTIHFASLGSRVNSWCRWHRQLLFRKKAEDDRFSSGVWRNPVGLETCFVTRLRMQESQSCSALVGVFQMDMVTAQEGESKH